MKQILQSLKSGFTEINDVPIPIEEIFEVSRISINLSTQ